MHQIFMFQKDDIMDSLEGDRTEKSLTAIRKTLIDQVTKKFPDFSKSKVKPRSKDFVLSGDIFRLGYALVSNDVYGLTPMYKNITKQNPNNPQIHSLHRLPKAGTQSASPQEEDAPAGASKT